MSVADLLRELDEQGIELWFEGERLRFRAPKGSLGAELKARLVAQRSEVLAKLRADAAADTKTFPLSFSQQSLWFLHQQAPASAAYHVALTARVLSPLGESAMAQAVQALMDRHASLRTTYSEDGNGAPCQRVVGAAPAAFAVHDVPHLGPAELRAAVEADYRRPFDLERGPILRVSLYRRAPEDQVLLLTVHHIAADGWSLMLLAEELFKLHAEATGGPPAGLPRPGLQYANYSTWQEQSLAGPEGDRLWAYWREKLAPPRGQVELPGDRRAPKVQSFRGASLPVVLPPALTESLKKRALEIGTTPFVLLLASFQAFLFRLTGAEDVIVGTPTFGRSKAEFMQVVGDFVNSVPLRGRLSARTPFRELAVQLKGTVVEALDAQELPLPLLVQRLHPEREASRGPLFNTFFILQRFDQFKHFAALFAGAESDPPLEVGGLRLAPYPLDQQEGQFDLALQMVERGGAFHGVFKYATDLFDPSTVAAFAADYLRVVEAIDRDPAVALGDLPEARSHLASRRETVAAVLERLQKSDIRLSLEGGKLRVSAPKGALTDEVKGLIAARRDEIVETLATDGVPSTAPSSLASTLRRIPRVGPLPVSSAQQRLWFLDRMDQGSAHYNIGASVRFRGPLDADVLERALEELARRHESLRTSIGERDGMADVRIAESARIPLERFDVSHLPPAEAEAEARDRAGDRLRAPFDVARGPVAGAVLVRVAPDNHVLTLGVHHIAADGWSLLISFREICQIYEALAAGRPVALPPLSVQYVDYAAWERNQLHGGQMGSHLAYWKQALAGAPAVLELPTDRSRPAAQSFRGRRIRQSFDPALVERLRQVARQHEATLYMVLLAGFQVLLHRYSGQEDIVVGSPIANRDMPALEGIVGCFVNNVVLRSRMSGGLTFAELLRQVKATTLSAFDHCAVPFDVLVDALRPERSSNHAPVFQVLFALQSYLTQVSGPAGIAMEPMEEPDLGISRFDLALELAEYEGKFKGLYEYSSDLFDHETVVRMHAHLVRLLGAIADAPGTRIEDLPLLVAEDERLLLGTWNDTAVEHDRSRCLHHLVESQAHATPHAVAARAGEATLSYRELEERANRLAQLLVRRGVQPGSLVGLCLDRTLDIPVALAAVLKTGAAYVPLDPAHPADRLRYTLGDAGVACAVTLARFAPLLAESGAPLVLLDEAEAELASMPSEPPAVAVKPEDRAYVIYTSGSTGRPKGVEVEHRNVVAFLEAMRREPGFAREDRLLAVTTLSFDIAGLEFWLPLSLGASVTIASRADVLDGERLIALLEEQRITVLQATPATFRLLLDSGWEGKRDLRILCGGEALPRDLASQLTPRVRELWNMYGPTETTIWSTVSRIEDGAPAMTIGRPIHNTRVYVLERSGALAPIGVLGELCIAGEGVARGYHDRPELTAEKFVTLTLPGGRRERAYRTGDVARFRADGRIDFLGRRDHQVKVRGYRIELGEIEAVLATHRGVGQCVVSAREDTPGDQRLVGYVVVTDGSPLDPEAVRSTLRSRLPEYMVPNLFVTLGALPLTPNGKIDRKALPAPQAAAPRAVEDDAEALMTPVQRRVAGSWREILRIDRIGLYENFFDIGGHSLLLVKLHAALKREFASDLALVELFQWTTVAAQAARLSAGAPTDGAVARAQARASRLNDG
jgi:amino acid adenylation domain-containing protein